MGITLASRFKSAWNSFMNKDPTKSYLNLGSSYSIRPDKTNLRRGNERSIVNAIYNRIAIDTASMTLKHVYMDDNGRFNSDVDSALNKCLTLEANIDQGSRAFLHDVVLSLLDEGVVAIVPVDTTSDPESGSFDIETMRTGKIVQWYPEHIRVLVYNDRKGIKEEITVHKNTVAIIENPFYSVMNGQNSTLKRLIRKMNMIDGIDEQASAGKFNMVVQLPYAVKSQARLDQAKARVEDLEKQLNNNRYGIAYIDATEKVTQLNRPLDNNLMAQIEYLTNQLFSQLGLTQEIMDGTASETAMLNYYNRTIEPICSAIADEMKRKFLSKNARTRGQSIICYRDPFRLTPVSQLAELADKFTRNEILTSNEIRQIIGIAPSNDPSADELRNKNLSQSSEEIAANEDMPIEDEAMETM